MTSLDPRRRAPTPVSVLATSPEVGAGLEVIAAAIARHFPENVFADLDLLARVIASRPDPRAYAERIAHLHALFGCEAPLRFRYTHDFLYGFDWARWVARDPSARASVGPYDEVFLAYSEQRAAELCALVAQNDVKYGPVARGTHRNPFPFRRDPEAEQVLHLALAAEDAIPVRAWDPAARAVWNRPFTALREAKAEALGLALDRPNGRRD